MILNVIDHCEMLTQYNPVDEDKFNDKKVMYNFDMVVCMASCNQDNNYDMSLRAVNKKSEFELETGCRIEIYDKIYYFLTFYFMDNSDENNPCKIGGRIYYMENKDNKKPIFFIQTPHIIKDYPDDLITDDYGWVGYDNLEELVHQGIGKHIYYYVKPLKWQ